MRTKVSIEQTVIWLFDLLCFLTFAILLVFTIYYISISAFFLVLFSTTNILFNETVIITYHHFNVALCATKQQKAEVEIFRIIFIITQFMYYSIITIHPEWIFLVKRISTSEPSLVAGSLPAFQQICSERTLGSNI